MQKKILTLEELEMQVYGEARGLGLREEDALDLAHDWMISELEKAAAQGGQLQWGRVVNDRIEHSLGKPGAYFKMCLRNHWVDINRKKRKEVQLGASLDPQAPMPVPRPSQRKAWLSALEVLSQKLFDVGAELTERINTLPNRDETPGIDPALLRSNVIMRASRFLLLVAHWWNMDNGRGPEGDLFRREWEKEEKALKDIRFGPFFKRLARSKDPVRVATQYLQWCNRWGAQGIPR